MPWLETSLGINPSSPGFAMLQSDILFPYPLQYFVQVKLSINHHGQYLAEPVESNGSGDFSNLIYTDAFMELPLDKGEFRKGEVYKVWRYHF
ncbi:MAG: molybdopterin molybdenumtransferase MoeA, partial [Bacteroidota bacterium]|nr:molybdopterin molybdenumtransferase MoeA [Bacteroidota bacterium]